MNSVDSRAPFFPRSRPNETSLSKAQQSALQRNTFERIQEIEDKTSKDAKVNIPEAIKDFARIKKAVDASEPEDNSEKIARLKQQIAQGSYDIDYDELADKILSSEY